jgi:RecA-family ATPase
MVMGKVSGVWGIDADDDDGIRWVEEKLPMALEDLRVAQTLRGRHYYFRIQKYDNVKSENLRHPLGVAVEFKGEGNLLIVPPSIRDNGFVYSWLYAPPWNELPELSPRYFDRFRTFKKAPPKKPLQTNEECEEVCPPYPGYEEEDEGQEKQDNDRFIFDFGRASDTLDFKGAAEGERNDKLYRQLCLLTVPGALNESDLTHIGRIFNATFSPPLPDQERDKVIEQAIKVLYKEKQKLRQNGGINFHKDPTEEPALKFDHNLSINPSNLMRPLNPYDWIFSDSLVKKDMGMIFGPPGVGKGFFTASLIISLASGTPLFDHWYPVRPFRVMSISVEDKLDNLHHRLQEAARDLDAEAYGQMDFRSFSFNGKVALTEYHRGKAVVTQNFVLLDEELKKYQPEVIILDTLARFMGGDENSNPVMNSMCELMEILAQQNNCNVILVHHSAKRAGDVIDDEPSLKESLSQTSVRGASSVAGVLRWILQLVPISTSLTKKLLNTSESLKDIDGTYVVAKVVKKNEGPREGQIILKKEDGRMTRVLALEYEQREEMIEEYVEKLIEEIKRRDEAGEANITFSKPEEGLGWNRVFANEAVKRALERGLILKERSLNKRGFFLRLKTEEEIANETAYLESQQINEPEPEEPEEDNGYE